MRTTDKVSCSYNKDINFDIGDLLLDQKDEQTGKPIRQAKKLT